MHSDTPLISVVIPHYPAIGGAEKALEGCLKSFEGYDPTLLEVIVIENDGLGFSVAVNNGLALARGHYFIVSNNDVEIICGSILDLTSDKLITIPAIMPEPRDEMPRCFYCVSREIYEKVLDEFGYWYDERFQMGYFEDDDLIRRLRQMKIEFKTIEAFLIHHISGGGLTMKQVGEQKYFDINQKKFIEKWINLPH